MIDANPIFLISRMAAGVIVPAHASTVDSIWAKFRPEGQKRRSQARLLRQERSELEITAAVDFFDIRHLKQP